jgi:hypothetical protein
MSIKNGRKTKEDELTLAIKSSALLAPSRPSVRILFPDLDKMLKRLAKKKISLGQSKYKNFVVDINYRYIRILTLTPEYLGLEEESPDGKSYPAPVVFALSAG